MADRLKSFLRKALRWPTVRGRLARRVARHRPFEGSYSEWIESHEPHPDPDRCRARTESEALPTTLVVLRSMSVGEALTSTLDSLARQWAQRWCLHIVGVTRESVRHELVETLADRCTFGPAEPLDLGSAGAVVVLDAGEQIAESALYLLGRALSANSSAILAYADEDRWHEGARTQPIFKPDWSLDTFLEHDYLSRSCAYRAAAFLTIGLESLLGDRSLIAVRIIAENPTATVVHLPHVLFHLPSPAVARAGSVHRQLALHLRAAEGARVTWEGDRVRFAMPNPPPRVSIIIPTRDRPDHLGACLESLRANTAYPDWEVVIVDNGSTCAETHAALSRWGREEHIRVERHDVPFNFSELNNHGVSRADGSVFCFLNDDTTVVSTDWLECMVEHAVRPRVGAVGALLRYPGGDVQHAGIVLGMGGLGLAGHVHRFADEHSIRADWRLRTLQEYCAVTAACMVVSRSAFEAVGGFDESLAVCFNDVDLCLRLRARGYRILWTPHAVLDHHEQVSRAERIGAADRAYSREIRRMFRRWASALEHDPFYHPHLALSSETPQLAAAPRSDLRLVTRRPTGGA